MREIRFLLKNEKGSVMVVGMLVLMLASLIGIAAITTSSIEVEVTANDKTHKENFYRAEGAAMLAAQLLEDEKDSGALQDLPYGQPDLTTLQHHPICGFGTICRVSQTPTMSPTITTGMLRWTVQERRR